MTRVASQRPTRNVHARRAPRAVGCAVITVSDTRGEDDDPSGDTIARLLARAGHRVALRVWVRDRVAMIRRAARSALMRRDIDAVVFTGGTGLAPRDRSAGAAARARAAGVRRAVSRVVG